MRYEKYVIFLLLAAIFAIDYAALSPLRTRVEDPASISSFHCTLLLAMGVSQISLLTFFAFTPVGFALLRVLWCFLLIVRASMCLLMLPACMLQLKFVQGNHAALQSFDVHVPLWIIRGLLQSLVLSLPLVWLRLAGLKIIQFRAGVELSFPATEHTLRRWQFSLARLLSVLTGVAIILGLLQYVIRLGKLPSDPGLWLFIVALCVGQAAIALAALWLTLGARRLPLRVATLACACGAGIALHYPFVGRTPTAATPDYAQLCALEAALIVGPLLVFRVLGYRVAFRPRED